jgi:hypothetical protein
MNPKEQHEKGVGERLLAALVLNPAFRSMGTPPEPDLLYDADDGRVLGIEVATAYYSNPSAQAAWSLARKQRNVSCETLGSPDQAICARIRDEIGDKCSKSYSGVDEIWLCIALDAALSDRDSIQECVHSLALPECASFKRVYLLWQAPVHEGGADCVEELIPVVHEKAFE